ncbi:MAG: dihydrolipoyl dehydrogenase family protein [Gammaproteobacteria bacterium]
MTETFDLVIIGSGPGGYRAAVLATLRDLRVAIVEAGVWGGCCLNRGCVPKKDWYHTARLVAASAGFADRGLSGTLQADLTGAWRHQHQVVRTVRNSYLDYMKRLSIRTIEGHGRLAGPGRVQVSGTDGERELHAHHIILATGANASLPGDMDLTLTPGRILNTDMLFDEPPPSGQRVGVLGSGVVATEFAYILRLLGKEVVWLPRSAPLHRTRFTPQARSALGTALDRYGIETHPGARLRTATTDGAGVHLTLEDGRIMTMDWLLLGTGRRPHTTDLGLNTAGIETDAHGYIQRDEFLQTAAPNVYAIGDCAGHEMTSNQALADATVAVHNLITGNTRRKDDGWVPFVVYSALELARLGMNDDEAEEREYEPAVGFAAFDTSPCALAQGDPEGFVRLLADMDTGALLGGEIVGAEAGELIHLLALAPDRDTALRWLAEGRFNHPARAEELLNATETLAGKWGLEEAIFGKP